MNGDLLSLIVIVVTIVVMVIAETNVAFMTLALCSGYVLSQFAGHQVFDFASNYIDPNAYPLYEVVHVGLLLIPAILVGIRFRRTQRGIKRLIEQIVPGLGFALLLTILLIDIVPSDVVNKVEDESYIVTSLSTFSVWLIVFAICSAVFDVLVKHANEPTRKGRGRPPKK